MHHLEVLIKVVPQLPPFEIGSGSPVTHPLGMATLFTFEAIFLVFLASTTTFVTVQGSATIFPVTPTAFPDITLPVKLNLFLINNPIATNTRIKIITLMIIITFFVFLYHLFIAQIVFNITSNFRLKVIP